MTCMTYLFLGLPVVVAGIAAVATYRALIRNWEMFLNRTFNRRGRLALAVPSIGAGISMAITGAAAIIYGLFMC